MHVDRVRVDHASRVDAPAPSPVHSHAVPDLRLPLHRPPRPLQLDAGNVLPVHSSDAEEGGEAAVYGDGIPEVVREMHYFSTIVFPFF